MRRLTLERRLYTVEERQPSGAWSADYQPAMRATPNEAPSISRATILRSDLLDRDVHCLSSVEADAALLALLNPQVFDLHEQKALRCLSDVHPMFGHPKAAGAELPNVEGTVQVAERLGVLAKHPKIFLRQVAGGILVPVPYIGDLLLFLEDASGPYCVNWTVKASQEDFYRPRHRLMGRPDKQEESASSDLRHQIEEIYYQSAGIRTVRISRDMIPRDLAYSLRDVFCWHSRRTRLSEEQRTQALNSYRAAVGSQEVAFDAVKRVASDLNTDLDSAKATLYQLIWKRQLRIDLYKPILMDQPLSVETLDPLAASSKWFARCI